MGRTLREAAIPAVGVAILLGFLVRFDAFLERGVRALIGRGPGSFPGWLPRFETVGTTVVGYSLLLELLIFLAAPALVFVLGYRIGRRGDVGDDHPALLGGLAIGGFVGLAVGRLLAVVWLGAMPLDPALRPSLAVPLPALSRLTAFVLAGFAGAALGAFETNDGRASGEVLASLPFLLFGLHAASLLARLAYLVL